MDDNTVKICSRCDGRIEKGPNACRHKELVTGPKQKWYFSNWTVVIGILIIGPLALPLVWFNKRYTVTMKVVLTIVVIVGTFLLLLFIVQLCLGASTYMQKPS